MSTLNANDIGAYLKDHPDFFNDNKKLLLELRIPHESGSSISLVKRQMVELRKQNNDLRAQLNEFVDIGRETEFFYQITHGLTLSLLDATDLQDAFTILKTHFEEVFKIQFTRIIWFSEVNSEHAKSCTFEQANNALGGDLTAGHSISGTLDENQRDFLFDSDAESIKSAAMTIIGKGDLRGIIAIGNEHPEYYQADMGTMFLTHIGNIFSFATHHVEYIKRHHKA